jgi:predicted metal-dependent hydrolase
MPIPIPRPLLLDTWEVPMDAAVTSGPQHMLALERANRVRLARASLKRKVAAGRVDAAEVVLSCPWEVESMSVSELLMSQKRWGRTRCRKFLQSIGLLESKSVGSLTQRQRLTLAALLSAKAQTSRAQSQRAAT